MNAENIYAYKLKGDVKKFSSIREAAEKLEGVDNAILSEDVLTLELSPSASEYDIFCALNDMCLSSGLDFDYYEEAAENAEETNITEEKQSSENAVEVSADKNGESKTASLRKAGHGKAENTTEKPKSKKRELDDDSKPAIKKWAVQLVELALSLVLILVSVIFDIDERTKTFLCLIAYTVVAYETIWTAVSAVWKKRYLDWSVGGLIAIICALFACGNYLEPAIIALLVQSIIVLGGLFSDLSLDKIKKRLFFKYDVLTPENASEDDDEILAIDAKEGDTYVVDKGEVIPFDCTVVSGEAVVDGFNYSGKHMPEAVEKGDKLFGGVKLKDGNLVVRVEKKVTKSLSYRIYKRVKEENPPKFSVVLLALSLVAAFVLPLCYIGGDGYLAGLKNTAYFAVCLFLISETYTLSSINRVSRISAVYRALTDGLANADGGLLNTFSAVDTVVFDGERLFENKINKMVCAAKYKGKASALMNSFGFNPSDLSLECKEYEKDGKTLVVASDSECESRGLAFKKSSSEGEVRYAFLNGEFVCSIEFKRELKKDAFGAMRELYDVKVKSVVLYSGDAHDLGEINEYFTVRDNLTEEQKKAATEELCASGKTVYFGNDDAECASLKVMPYSGEKTTKTGYIPEGNVRSVAKAIKGAKRFACRKKLCVLSAAFKVLAIAFCGVMIFAFGKNLMWTAVLISEVVSAICLLIAYCFGKEIY
ncbi:MAG: hypothetical protein PUJ49_00815 [bacterium]|nr:hypothetical protein [bacterium]